MIRQITLKPIIFAACLHCIFGFNCKYFSVDDIKIGRMTINPPRAKLHRIIRPFRYNVQNQHLQHHR